MVQTAAPPVHSLEPPALCLPLINHFTEAGSTMPVCVGAHECVRASVGEVQANRRLQGKGAQGSVI